MPNPFARKLPQVNFELEPWEVPPGSQASDLKEIVEVGPLDWRGHSTFASATLLHLNSSGQGQAYFRPHCTAINFVVLQGSFSIAQNSLRHFQQQLKSAVERTAQSPASLAGRVFYVERRLCLLTGYGAAWLPAGGRRDRNAQPSVFAVPFDALTEPSARVFAWLSAQWGDADSPVRLAGEWSAQSPAARERVLREKVPQWRELTDLMNWIACAEQLPVGKKWDLRQVPLRNRSLTVSPKLHEWRDLLALRFYPVAPPADLPQCLADSLRLAANNLSVAGAETTAHERLEAHLRLREWLQGNAPERLDLVQ